MSYPPPVIQALLLLLVIPAAFIDFRQHRIPNWLSLAGLVLGIGMNFFLYETPGLWNSLKGVGIALLIYFPLFMIRGMGAGDVKLMAAIGAIVGWANWLGILVLTAAFGGIAALVLVLSKGRLRSTFRNIGLIVMSLRYGHAPYEGNPELDVGSERAVRLPHAVTIAFGAMGFLVAAYIWAPK